MSTKKNQSKKKYSKHQLINFFVFAFLVIAIPLTIISLQQQQTLYNKAATTPAHIDHVFLIMMENHNWADIKGKANYITNTLLPAGGHTERYYNPPGIHPSEPNYIWLEAGSNLGVKNDSPPSTNHQRAKNHLVTLLTNSRRTWKAYQEGISGSTCPLQVSGKYAPKHLGPIFFDDVTNTNNSKSTNCIQHIRPYTELATDLQRNTVANYALITPDLCNDMHDCSVATGDSWLAKEVPKILNSSAYKNGGALFITWDEGEGSDGPIGMIVLSPYAKKNYANAIHYDHSSFVKTVEEIFGLNPLLGDAIKATDLSDFFTMPLTSGAATIAPTSSLISPTFSCIGTNNCVPTAILTKIPVAPTANPSGGVSSSTNEPTDPVSPTTVINETPSASSAPRVTHGHKQGFISFLIAFILLIFKFLFGLIKM